MSSVGIAVAGANQTADCNDRQHGLMTGEELAALDLRRCELAVVSACVPRVEEFRRAGQGVAGLGRALHQAGARDVLTPIWPVSDDATRRLMSRFDDHLWHEGKSAAQALREAKAELRRERDSAGRPRWMTRDRGAFILTTAVGT